MLKPSTLRGSSTSFISSSFGLPTTRRPLTYHRTAAGSSPQTGDFSPTFGVSRPPRYLPSAAQPQLLEDVSDVGLDRVAAQAHLLGDLLVRASLQQQGEHLAPLGRQAGFVHERLEPAGLDPRGAQEPDPLALAGPTHRLADPLGSGSLVQVAVGAR